MYALFIGFIACIELLTVLEAIRGRRRAAARSPSPRSASVNVSPASLGAGKAGFVLAGFALGGIGPFGAAMVNLTKGELERTDASRSPN